MYYRLHFLNRKKTRINKVAYNLGSERKGVFNIKKDDTTVYRLHPPSLMFATS